MVRVVGKDRALGAGVGGKCSSMDGSKTITRRYPGRGSVYFSGGFRYLVGRSCKRKRYTVAQQCLSKYQNAAHPVVGACGITRCRTYLDELSATYSEKTRARRIVCIFACTGPVGTGLGAVYAECG